jgi:hypothetical protein
MKFGEEQFFWSAGERRLCKLRAVAPVGKGRIR